MFSLTDIKMVRSHKTILDIDTLTLPTDRLTVILGHNGSGKSTLVNLLSGQHQPDQGCVLLHGRPINQLSAKIRAREIAYLPQKLPSAAGLTVREVIKLGRFPWRGLLGRWNQEDKNIIQEAMVKTGVEHFAEDFSDSLSGGERQRTWIAMLLAQQSPILILDEPTSALDVQHQYQLMGLLKSLCHEGSRGIIVILHDLNLALQYADHIVALKGGRVSFEGAADQLLNEDTLSELYQTSIRLIDHPMEHGKGTKKVAVVCA